MNLFKNNLQPTSNRSLDLPEVSFLSAPINSTARPHSNSVHDLRSLDGAPGSTEMDLGGNRRALYRARKNRRLDDSLLRRPPIDQQCLKNSSSESVIDRQSLSQNRLTVPFSSGVSSTISQIHSSSSHGSMECLDGSTRKPPEPLQGVLLKSRKRPMKGWHERFFSLSNGCLSYAKNKNLLNRGRNWTQIDLANTYVTSEPDKLKIDIDASAVVYHLKFEEAAKFHQWLIAIKEHRGYDQYQSAITSSGLSNANPTVCGVPANPNGDRIISNNTSLSSPDTPDVKQVPARPNSIDLRNVPPAVQLRVTKATNRMSNEHIAAMEKLILRLGNAYQELANAQSMLLEANIPENDPTEADNSSPTRSVFFSPVPFNSFEGRTSSTVTEHRRLSSISSITSMCTAVQGPTTDVIDPRSANKNHVSASYRAIDFVRAAAGFSDEAKRFIEEANEALATIQQINQLCNNRLTPNKERKQVQSVNNKLIPPPCVPFSTPPHASTWKGCTEDGILVTSDGRLCQEAVLGDRKKIDHSPNVCGNGATNYLRVFSLTLMDLPHPTPPHPTPSHYRSTDRGAPTENDFDVGTCYYGGRSGQAADHFDALTRCDETGDGDGGGRVPFVTLSIAFTVEAFELRPQSLNERLETDSDSESSSVDNTGDSQSDDIPILNESKMHVPDMKDVVLKNPEPVAGRRTVLPARQPNSPAFSLLALLRSYIGRDLTKLRLPAILNEPLSVLQVSGSSTAFCPANLCEEMEYSQLLDAAADIKDRIHRMLYVASFAISGYAYTAGRTATKSFTPLLGETFECIRPEKQWRFMAEQVCSSPPVAAVHCESKLWTYDQEYGIRYKFWGKTLELTPTGGCQLYFPRWRETYTWSKVTTSVTNLVSPTGRTLNHAGDMIVECSNGVTGSIHFSKVSSAYHVASP
ncbi:unnamed protein product [Taenia asiatica]|uniref:PH domain-containing protein n=1 Tax=Taenia asiatica TaxID=60517 RepID=A0A0R3WEU8_TAEAS|nr:unnamed protein product [Taenia asiatica]